LVKEKGPLLRRVGSGDWNASGSRSFPAMTVSLSQLLEDSFLIAWEYLSGPANSATGLLQAGF
jgi:hypothetical protein